MNYIDYFLSLSSTLLEIKYQHILDRHSTSLPWVCQGIPSNVYTMTNASTPSVTFMKVDIMLFN